MRDPRLLHAVAVVDGAVAGGYGLPEAVIAAHATLEAMRRAEKVTGVAWEEVRPADVAQRLAEEMLDTGASPQAGALEAIIQKISDAESGERAAALGARVARLAVELAELRFVATVDECREAIIVDHLRPALRETLEEVRGLAEVLEGSNLQDPVRLLGDAKRGAAFQGLVAAHKRHGAIRDAQRHLNNGNLPEPAELAILKNAPELWRLAGLNWRSRRQFGRSPVPTDPLEAIVWMTTTPDAQPWIPTRAEFEQLAEEIAATSRLRPAPTMVG